MPIVVIAHFDEPGSFIVLYLLPECNLKANYILSLSELLKFSPRAVRLPESVAHFVSRYINCRMVTLFKVNLLLQHIERACEQISSPEGSRTNNAAERIIFIDYNIRVKTIRFFKSFFNVLLHFYLS